MARCGARRAVCRAEVASASGDDPAATVAVRAALAQARREELLSAGLGALVPLARILQRRGARAHARRITAFLSGHPRASFETRRAAIRVHGQALDPRPAWGDDGPEGVLHAFDEALAEL